MESIDLILILTSVLFAGLVGLGIWLHHVRSTERNQMLLEQIKQDNLNYRAGLRSGVAAPSQNEPEMDLMTFISDFATKNPEMVKNFLESLGKKE